MRSQPTQERNEVAITVPFDGELKIWQLPYAILRKESLHESLVLEALELLMMHQEKLDHAGIPHLQSTFILCVKVIRVLTHGIEALFQIIGYLNMLSTPDIAEELIFSGI